MVKLASQRKKDIPLNMKATTIGHYAPWSAKLLRIFAVVLIGFILNGAALGVERIVCLGDSLTAGYGLDPEYAFPALLQRSLGESLPEVEVVNAGLSGDTTAGGLRRVNWVLKTPADILVVALGGNDALRGLPPEETRANLMAIIKTARERVPGIRIVLAGMLAPPNMGEAYQLAFAEAYREVVEATKVEFMPFLLEGVAANPELNLADGIHPNAQGQAVIARNILEVLNL